MSAATINTNRLIVHLPMSYLGDKRSAYGLFMDMTFSIPPSDGNKAYLEIFGNILKPRRKLRSDLQLGEDGSKEFKVIYCSCIAIKIVITASLNNTIEVETEFKECL